MREEGLRFSGFEGSRVLLVMDLRCLLTKAEVRRVGLIRLIGEEEVESGMAGIVSQQSPLALHILTKRVSW